MQTREQSDAMIMTVLEAHVEPDQWESLRQAYTSAGSKLPPQMVETFLVQSTSDPKLWRGISIWRSREALEEYRGSTETPGGVLIFRAAGAEPALSIFAVAARQANAP
jgi:quinol monooxygenase YgiN